MPSYAVPTEPSRPFGSEEKGYLENNCNSCAEAERRGLGDHGDVVADPDAPRALHRKLKSRHMQMIAIGGAIGAGLFVGSGKALSEGGPASLVICFIIIGIFMLMVMQALAELGVMYPVNGAFFSYTVRFVDPSWGFAIGWDYAINWLTLLPFELTAAGITLQFWKASRNVDIAVWVTIFLALLCMIQYFGVKGYGEVEFVLSIIKIVAIVGFLILGIIIDTGGVGPKGYIGAAYWYNPGAFNGGFLGFCSVFSTASFAFSGTELTGLAAAEASDPLKSIPKAAKQVLWRLTIFYVVSLLMVGLIVPWDAKWLLGATNSADTKVSPFVGAIARANINVLPSIFNFVITIAVLSVANSCTYGSTRTMQALALAGMGPKFLTYVDKKGRPVWSVLIQLAFGLLAYVQNANDSAAEIFFTCLLALAGVANFFIWGSICVAHIRFRAAWRYHGHGVDEIPYRAQFGVIGSWIGLFLATLCIMASFYTSVQPLDAETFFELWLSGPLILALYLFWKVWTNKWWPLLVPLSEIDVMQGVRGDFLELQAIANRNRVAKTWSNLPKRIAQGLF